ECLHSKLKEPEPADCANLTAGVRMIASVQFGALTALTFELCGLFSGAKIGRKGIHRTRSQVRHILAGASGALRVLPLRAFFIRALCCGIGGIPNRAHLHLVE